MKSKYWLCCVRYGWFLFTVKLIAIIIILPLIDTNEVQSPKQNEDLFKQLFKLRRAEQLEAVKKMTKIEESRQLKMVQTVTKTIFEVIQKSKTVLENSGFTPGVSAFPESEPVRDALSLVVENSALMGELVLRLPDVAVRVLNSNPDWPPLLSWGIQFTQQTRLVDNVTDKLFHLVRQELNFTERDPDYVNPYRKVKPSVAKSNAENEMVKKKQKKQPLPRGPRLTVRQEL